jgi:hypothetical protein
MPDTHRKVKVTTDPGIPNVTPFAPVVMVDDKPLYGVTEIEFKHNYSDGGPPVVKVTLIGADVDLEGIPDYMVRVVGPRPKFEDDGRA